MSVMVIVVAVMIAIGGRRSSSATGGNQERTSSGAERLSTGEGLQVVSGVRVGSIAPYVGKPVSSHAWNQQITRPVCRHYLLG
jgi:hypothetical protein